MKDAKYISDQHVQMFVEKGELARFRKKHEYEKILILFIRDKIVKFDPPPQRDGLSGNR